MHTGCSQLEASQQSACLQVSVPQDIRKAQIGNREVTLVNAAAGQSRTQAQGTQMS